ncbi:MAG TPA: hypothetical protein VGB26_06720 [Nitrospiria bacterium]|jgi:hypothetical protein
MENRFTRLLLVLTVAVALAGTSFTAPIVFGQQSESGTKADHYPTFFKVYSKDGRESLTASCTPIDLSTVVNQVTCKFIHVRFDLPEERPDKTAIPLSVEEALKADPTLAQEVKKNPKKFEQEMRKGLEKVKQGFCSPSSKERVAIETKMRDPEMGPKRKNYYQQWLAACSDKDPSVFVKRMLDLERRTCGLWVDHFRLEFKKAREGQWLYRQETPGLLSKVLKVYELTGDSALWTLSETRVPTEGAEEQPAQTVWSWKNVTEYEMPCEFISHSLIQFP